MVLLVHMDPYVSDKGKDNRVKAYCFVHREYILSLVIRVTRDSPCFSRARVGG